MTLKLIITDYGCSVHFHDNVGYLLSDGLHSSGYFAVKLLRCSEGEERYSGFVS